jgi:hypothetical protein
MIVLVILDYLSSRKVTILMTRKRLDKAKNKPIVNGSQLHKKAPPDGVRSTNRGLTSQAEVGSLEAMSDPISTPSSRQLLPQANDDFLVPKVEYDPPPQEIVDKFVEAVCSRLVTADSCNAQIGAVELERGFRQFLDVVINIQTKHMNRSANEQHKEK